MDEKQKKILGRLQTQCARREYCSKDIFKKALEKTEGDEAAAQEILQSLLSDGFVSDLRYASAFSREKSGISGWGPAKISFALRAKGIGREEIEAALLDIDPDKADSKLRKLMEHKWKSLQSDPQGKLKLLRFALSRGYSYDKIRALAEEITSQSVSDDI